MGGLFGGTPKVTTPAPPAPAPPPPTIDTAAKNQDSINALRQKRGAASTVLAGSNPTAPQTAVSRLLGQ